MPFLFRVHVQLLATQLVKLVLLLALKRCLDLFINRLLLGQRRLRFGSRSFGQSFHRLFDLGLLHPCGLEGGFPLGRCLLRLLLLTLGEPHLDPGLRLEGGLAPLLLLLRSHEPGILLETLLACLSFSLRQLELLCTQLCELLIIERRIEDCDAVEGIVHIGTCLTIELSLPRV